MTDRLSTADMCKALGVSPPALGKWSLRFGFPKPVQRGWYDLAEVMGWLRRAWQDADAKVGEKNQDERKTRLQADKLEIEIQQKRASLVDRDQAMRAVERGIAEFSAQLQNLPRHVAAVVPQDLRNEVEDLVAREVRVALKSLSQCRDLPGAVEDDG